LSLGFAAGVRQSWAIAKGVNFGLVTQAPEDEDEEWNVIAEPGNYMAFYPPWDGDYDT
jgi:hypothetical protein